MRAIYLFLAGSILATWCSVVWSKQPGPEEAEPNRSKIRRFSFIVSSDDGGKSRPKLRYANSDALSMAKVLRDLGGLDSENEVLLINPKTDFLLKRMSEFKQAISKSLDHNVRNEFLFYYSGHSDEEGLLFGNDHLSYRELKKSIQSLATDISIIILDSCASGSFTRLKGGQKRPPFLSDSLSKLKGYVVLTSSSAEETAQESDRIKASYFTHYLVSGLRGAADFTGDQKITLNEAYQYAYYQTLAGTEKTFSGAQHPSYNIQLSGSGELVMTDIRKTSGKMILSKSLQGKFFIRDKSEKLVAEIDKATSRPMMVGLEPGDYSILWVKDKQVATARRNLQKEGLTELAAGDFSQIDGEKNTIRGDREKDYSVVPAEFSVYPGLSTNILDPEETKNYFAMSLFYSKQAYLSGASFSLLGGSLARDGVEGFQYSTAFNKTLGNLEGTQISIGYNLAQEVSGAQISAGFNDVEKVTGAQVGGYNHATQDFTGVQVGAGLNQSLANLVGAQITGGANLLRQGNVEGLQISGVYNVAQEVRGAQISGGFNNAQRVTGAQIGLYNRNSEKFMGAQIGGYNELRNTLTGIQIGAGNYAPEPVLGVQIGTVNFAKQRVLGLQIGAVNYTAEELQGAQIGGLINSAEKFEGAQIGLFNQASEANGAQIGLINCSKKKDGIPIGLLNLVADSTTRITYSVSEELFQQIALKYGGEYTYSFLQAGYQNSAGHSYYSKALGLGGFIPFGIFYLNIETLLNLVDRDKFFTTQNLLLEQTRLGPGVKLTSFLSLFVQAIFYLKVAEDLESGIQIWESNKKEEPWTGYTAGLEFSF